MIGTVVVTISIIFSILELRRIARIQRYKRKKQLQKINSIDKNTKDIKDIKEHINPVHYKVGGIETIDYIKAKLSKKEFEGYLKGNIIKYLSRAGYKDKDKIDFKKALWYLEKLIDCI